MKIIADESVDYPLILALRSANFDVDSIMESCPGASDEVVFRKANEAESILLTMDKDFGEIVYRLGKVTKGVVLLRLSGETPEMKKLLVLSLFRKFSEKLTHSFTVVTPAKIRIRKKHE